METRKQLAERLGVKLSTMSTTLSVMKFPATQTQVIDGRATYLYDEAAAAKIEALFKPVGEAPHA